MITVIGGSGFIGTRLCKNLAEKQIPFEIVDIKVSGHFPEKTKICDIRNIETLRKAIAGDKIIHLAAVHRDDVRDKALYHDTNVIGTKNICLVASEKCITQITFTSSVAVYGFAEADTGESGAIDPFNEYGKTKFEGEEVLRSWMQDNGGEKALTIIRPTVVFGEGNRGNVYNLLRQIQSGRFLMIGHGKNRKSMAYVENIVAFLEYTTSFASGYSVYNYVDKPDFDMNTLVSHVRKEVINKEGVGVRLPYWFGLLLGYIADGVSLITNKRLPISSIRIRKFAATTAFDSAVSTVDGFKAPFSLEDGLRRTLEAEFIKPDPNREVFYTE